MFDKTEKPEQPMSPADAFEASPKNVGQALGSDRDERRLIAAAVRLLMRLPRAARYGLLALGIAGGADLSGLDTTLLDALFAPSPVVVHKHHADPRGERLDQEAIDAR